LGAIESCDRLLALLRIRHLNESEAARAAGIAVGHDAYAIYLTVSREELPQVVF
jgi:hypothetical protein